VKTPSVLLALALLSAITLFAPAARAQDPADGLGAHSANLFADFSSATVGQGDGWIWGGSAGGYYQSHLLGFVLRGSAVPGGDTIHVYEALAGPRLALDIPILKPFIEATGGMGHSGYYDGIGNFARAWGPAWQVDAGVEHGLFPHLRWRIVDVAYGHVYVGPGISPTIISTGLALHL
jgi:hypothetical protein